MNSSKAGRRQLGGPTDGLIAALAPATTVVPSFPFHRQKSAFRAIAFGIFVILGATQVFETIQNSFGRNNSQRKDATVRKPLSSYINSANQSILHNVDELLNFAIIGHGKCGTTFLQNRLRQHPQVSMCEHELRKLQQNNLTAMIAALYELDPTKMRGYKNPNDIQLKRALDAIHEYWPKTKLIVGVRHPIKHFESYYNFRVRHGIQLRPADDLVGSKFFNQSLFHHHLARLGKTDMTDPAEAELLDLRVSNPPQRMLNPVFLYESSQLFDTTDERRNWQLATDLQFYLGLEDAIAIERTKSTTPWSVMWRRLKRLIRGTRKPQRKSEEYHSALDICDDRHFALRRALLYHGDKAAKWIRQYFLVLSDVTVSDPAHFEALLDTWATDPCEERLLAS